MYAFKFYLHLNFSEFPFLPDLIDTSCVFKQYSEYISRETSTKKQCFLLDLGHSENEKASQGMGWNHIYLENES